MKITVGITTFNRRSCLEKMAATLAQTRGNDRSFNLKIYDDHSSAYDLDYLKALFPQAAKIHRHETNQGSSPNSFWMYKDFVMSGDDHLLNADADLLFHPDWLQTLRQLLPKTKGFLSLYNSVLHPASRSFQLDGVNVLEKEHIGPAGVVISHELMSKVVNEVPGPYKGYDWVWCAHLKKAGIPLLSTEASYLQHIGLDGFNSGGVQFFDFGLNFHPSEEPAARFQAQFFQELSLRTKDFYENEERKLAELLDKRLAGVIGRRPVRALRFLNRTLKPWIQLGIRLRAKVRFRLKHPLGL